MSNHIHVIVNSNEPTELSDTIRDFKKFLAKACFNQFSNGIESRKEWMLQMFTEFGKESTRHKTFKFWKMGNHTTELYSAKFPWIKLKYIHQNPVRAGLVINPEDWIYSSASNYMELESKIPEVIRIDPYLNTH